MEGREGLLEKIRPPRIEDAGLEDCALPPDSIREAFLKAASAVSILSPSDDEDCLHDPWPTAGDSSDALADVDVGLSEGEERVVGAGDDVEKEEGESRVEEALQGLKIGDEDKNNEDDESDFD